MFWFLGLPFEKPEDFWLNVLAGVPFLLFDIVIITLLLPRTIEWLNARRWDRTRRRVLGHVLKAYRDSLVLRDFQAMGRRTQGMSAPQIRDFVHQQARNFIAYAQATARAMETEIQTALPILDPERSMAILDFHYKWKTYMLGTELVVRNLEDYLDRTVEDPASGPSGAVAASAISAHRQSALRIGIAYRQLQTYLKPHNAASETETQLIGDPVDRVLNDWWDRLDPLSGSEVDSDGHRGHDEARDAANLKALTTTPDVELHGRRWLGLFGRTWLPLYRAKSES